MSATANAPPAVAATNPAITVPAITVEEFQALIDEQLAPEGLSSGDTADDIEEVVPPPPPSATALMIDMWTEKYVGRLAKRDDLKEPFKEIDANELADLHALTFEPQHVFAENPAQGLVERRQAWLQEMVETTDFQSMHNQTVGNMALAEIATVSVAQQWKSYRTYLLEQQGGGGQGDNAPQSPDTQDPSASIRQTVAAANAVREMRQQVGDAKDALDALGCGSGSGANSGMDGKRAAELFKHVRKNRTLWKIMQLAGRYRRLAQSKQFTKQVHGRDDMVGIELDGDPARLIPSELGQLVDEDLEMDALRRLVERSSMCREYKGLESVGKGPIVVCVDESGSMSGNPIENAKAMALALAWVARHQNRWCALVSFSDGNEGEYVVLKPGEWGMEDLIGWLDHFYGGGTDPHVPLETLPFRYWQEMGCPKGKTDLVLVTDACLYIDDAMVKRFNAWKKEEDCQALGIVLGYDPGPLAQVCNRTWRVNNLSLDDTGGSDVIGEVLSI